MDDQLPTRGQQRILQFAGRDNRQLRAIQSMPHSPITYQIVELHDTAPPRLVMEVTARMLHSLRTAHWIEHVPGGNEQMWTYRLTQAGLEASVGPART